MKHRVLAPLVWSGEPALKITRSGEPPSLSIENLRMIESLVYMCPAGLGLLLSAQRGSETKATRLTWRKPRASLT